jgi:predicted O-linked N-acetylglucosamine transferase (SPINDLY family)
MAIQRHQAGQLAEAEALYRQILAIQPNQADALHLLGMVAHQCARHDLAVNLIGRALVVNPGLAAAYSNLGEAYRSLGRVEEAIHAYRHAIALQPDLLEAHRNLALTLMFKADFPKAAEAFRRVLELRPDSPEAHNNLGLALTELRRLEEAMAAYRRALELRPNYAIAQSNLGSVLRERGRFAEAIAAGRLAVEMDPASGEALNNLGIALAEGGHLEEAMPVFRRALEIKPHSAMAHNNLGNALKDQGRIEEAVVELRQAVQLAPERAWVHSNLIYALHFDPREDDHAIAREQQLWNRHFAEPRKTVLRPHRNDPNPERRLRVGYVSAEFYDHVVGRNLLPLLEHHDPAQFEVFCYSAVVNPDQFTETIRRRGGHWRETIELNDEAFFDTIRRDGIDILVDLSQHMAGNRLPFFALQPAPVQVSFAGYPAGTGLKAIGHRISDRYLESGRGVNEQVHLIDSFWCYHPGDAEVEVNALPAESSGKITFGSLNNFCKVNEALLKVWGRVLAAVPESRLILMAPVGNHRQETLNVLRREGIDEARIEFVERSPRRAYLELHRRIDIVLDSYPYNGHTTSLDALWMGVPVVTQVGKQAVSRAGYSQLSNLGLTELLAISNDQYIGIATALAGDLLRLARLRSNLRPRLQASLLGDSRHFARSIESAYRTMWRRWCANGSQGGR